VEWIQNKATYDENKAKKFASEIRIKALSLSIISKSKSSKEKIDSSHLDLFIYLSLGALDPDREWHISVAGLEQSSIFLVIFASKSLNSFLHSMLCLFIYFLCVCQFSLNIYRTCKPLYYVCKVTGKFFL
jgi:hypothetical protein